MGRVEVITCTIGATLIFLICCLGPETTLAASTSGSHDTAEKTRPQGNDPLGADEDQRTTAPTEHKGSSPSGGRRGHLH
jgi:hypothetical protein